MQFALTRQSSAPDVLRGAYRLLNRILNPLGILISRPEIIHGSPRFSGVTEWSRRVFQLRPCFAMIENVEGAIVESGVEWGYGVLAQLLLVRGSRPRKIYAFDSFAGASRSTDQDSSGGNFIEPGRPFRIAPDDVWKTLRIGSTLGDDELKSAIEIVPGWIQDTMPAFRRRAEAQNIRIALAVCDCDLYEPVRATLQNIWPILSVGGLVVLGKLDNPKLMGKTIAVREFLATLDKSAYELSGVEIRGPGYELRVHSVLKKLAG